MADYVVIVPKQDELMATEWGFKTDFGRRDERTPSGVELYRRSLPAGEITFALLDKQTNTYSSILTADVIARETPKLAFLVGTALGHAGRAPVGSVVISDGVIDISEKRYTDDGRASYVPRGPIKSDELTLDAKEFVARQFTQERIHTHIRAMTRAPRLVRGTSNKLSQFISRHNPNVMCEPIVSGNEYRMTTVGTQAKEIWDQATTARAYDMEAAGFAFAGENYNLPWLVIRGISDHGTAETKNDYNRTIAAGIAARFLSEFLERGLVRVAAQSPLLQEPSITISQLRDEAYRLDGSWHGVMAYLDDDGSPVVFQESAEFNQVGSNVDGLITSRKVRGRPRHDNLEYRINFLIAKHGYAGGIWSETVAARQYFGVMLGQLDDDSRALSGTWLGTHRGGVRKGYFKWYNIEREGNETRVAFDLQSAANDLIARFTQTNDPFGALAL
jgi:nucleoside phosphorylase